MALRPFRRRRIRTRRPFWDLFRARKPERRFCTRREGRNVSRFTPREAVAEKARLCCDCWESIEDTERVVGVHVDGGREKGCGCWGRTGVERRVEEKGLEEVNAEGVALVCSVNLLALQCEILSLVPCLGYLMLRSVDGVPVNQGPGSGQRDPEGGQGPAAETEHDGGPKSGIKR